MKEAGRLSQSKTLARHFGWEGIGISRGAYISILHPAVYQDDWILAPFCLSRIDIWRIQVPIADDRSKGHSCYEWSRTPYLCVYCPWKPSFTAKAAIHTLVIFRMARWCTTNKSGTSRSAYISILHPTVNARMEHAFCFSGSRTHLPSSPFVSDKGETWDHKLKRIALNRPMRETEQDVATYYANSILRIRIVFRFALLLSTWRLPASFRKQE